MSAPGAGTASDVAPGWLRRNRWWLAGTVVLGALAFVLPHRAAKHEWERRGYTHPVEGRAGGWTGYEDSRWRLVEVRRKDVSGVAGGYLHPEASMLLLVYEVIPGKQVGTEVLDRCVGRVSDGRGRYWGGVGMGGGANSNPFTWEAQARTKRELGLDTGCGSRPGGDGLPAKARPTRPFRFFHMFLVPRELSLQDLYGEIVVDPYNATPPGSYVRFKLAGDRPGPAGAGSHSRRSPPATPPAAVR